ncbi:ATP-binding protein [Nostoc sp. CALU 546]|uniref:ATP-binding protein n=1 Tax=Nostoc sp. CALU 546 TaxID=1867241 RepID=UPI003B66B8C3
MINAIQYTSQTGKVTDCLYRSDHYAVIQIQNTGTGIPQQNLTRIIDRFLSIGDRSVGWIF